MRKILKFDGVYEIMLAQRSENPLGHLKHFRGENKQLPTSEVAQTSDIEDFIMLISSGFS